jgi:hypothetical protein
LWHASKLDFIHPRQLWLALCQAQTQTAPLDIRFVHTTSGQQLQEHHALVVRATMENCDSRPASHVDATRAPRSFSGEEELRLGVRRHRTPEHILQARNDSNCATLPFKQRGIKKPWTRMPRTTRSERGNWKVKQETSACDRSFEFENPVQMTPYPTKAAIELSRHGTSTIFPGRDRRARAAPSCYAFMLCVRRPVYRDKCTRH